MQTDIQITARLVTETCYLCGMTFAMPEQTQKAFNDNGHTFYCPLGHGQVYSKKQNLEKQLAQAQRLLTAEKCLKANTEALRMEAIHDLQREREDRAREALKTKRRHAAGKCPCCQRSFASLARHIKHMHPEYLRQERKLP